MRPLLVVYTVVYLRLACEHKLIFQERNLHYEDKIYMHIACSLLFRHVLAYVPNKNSNNTARICWAGCANEVLFEE